MDFLVALVMILVVSALVAAAAVITAGVILWINKSARKTRNRK